MSNVQVNQMVAERGYTNDKLQVGLTLYNEVMAIYQQQQTYLATKAEATRHCTECVDRANGFLSEYIDIARLAFEEKPEILEKLKVKGRRKHNFSSWLEEGRLFYTNALSIPEAVSGFSGYNVSVEKLQQGQQALLEAETASIQKTNAIASAQEITDQKTLAYKKLMKWWRDFRNTAKIALESHPQLMEHLRLVVPSRT